MKFQTMALSLALLFILLIAACSGSTNDPGKGVATIDSTAVDTTSLEGKLARLTERLKFGPDNWRLLLERSKLFYEMNNMPRAMADIENAVKFSITEPEPYYMRGFYYYVDQKDSAALRDFQRAADLNSENPETYYQIGNIRLFQKEYDKAEAAYDYAIKLDSLEPTYVFAKGLMRKQQGQTDKAIGFFNDALKCDPTFIKALLALHDVWLVEKHNPDQAYAYNERVMLIDSTQPLAHFNQGNFFRVRANKVKNPEKSPDYQVLLKIALSEYNLCLKYDPQFVEGIYNRGYTFFLLEKYSAAEDDFSKVIDLDPYHRDAFYMKANIQEHAGDLVSALANYERAAEIDPKFFDAVNAVKELNSKVKSK